MILVASFFLVFTIGLFAGVALVGHGIVKGKLDKQVHGLWKVRRGLD